MPVMRDMDNSSLASKVTVVCSGGFAVHRPYLLPSGGETRALNPTCSMRLLMALVAVPVIEMNKS